MTPNGIVRYYIVRYKRQDGNGNETVLNPVKMQSQEIEGLLPSINYVVNVQAFTVKVGPAALITVSTNAKSLFSFVGREL